MSGNKNNIVSNDRYAHLSERQLLSRILVTLESMKQQEFDYWEAWKQAKKTEQNKENSAK